MPFNESNHYVTLGLDQDCTDAHIRAAYRLLAKQHHPDVNSISSEAKAQTQALNAAYEILSDPARRKAYDQQLAAQKKASPRIGSSLRNTSQEVQLRLEEFLCGATLQVSVIDPAETNGHEVYELVVPAETAPGTRFRVPRAGGGFVTVKTKARADARFKVRGSDLRCDLRISFERAQKGGSESVRDVTGAFLRIQVPPSIRNGEVVRIAGKGLPKSRGGRGDLLVRISYRPEVRITRVSRR